MPGLQKFDYLNSRYERPNLKWVCGRAQDGAACRNGPDSKGQCCGVSECEPVREGDRWICTRPPSAGGPCELGPMSDGVCAHPIPPCVPVRTLRSTRGLVVRWAVAVTIGFLAVVLGSSGMRWLEPGPLITAHASLENCQSCHSGVSLNPFTWAVAAFSPSSPEKDSGKCVSCHVTSGNALGAHGVVGSVLEASTKRIVALGGDSGGALHDSGSAIPCATCHVEHGGEKAPLTEVAETACQACHVSRFHGFSKDHPEFTSYPYERRTRLVFDHDTHLFRAQSYFAKEASKKNLDEKSLKACVNCHSPADDGGLMLTRNFENTCSGCHLKSDILNSDHLPSDVAVLAVPGLDVETLRQEGIDIGDWPADAEGRLTPFMKLLLSADKETVAALGILESLPLLDLKEALSKAASEEEKKQKLEAIRTLARGVKRLYHELQSAGPQKFGERLSAIGGKTLDERILRDLFSSMPRDVLLAARCESFPNLKSDLGLIPEGAEDEANECRVPSKVAVKTGDGQAQPEPASNAGQKDTGDILSGSKDTGDILSGTKDTGDILLGAANTGDILSGAKDTGDILSGAPDTGDILSGAKDTGDILSGAPPSDSSNDKSDAADAPSVEEVGPQEYARTGGWYRQDFSIVLQPSRHAEPFLKAWLEFAASAFGTPAQTVVEPVFATLTRKNALGRCVKCHSVDRREDGSMSIQWTPKHSGGSGGGFTRFRHGPHLSLAPDRSCASCHVQEGSAKYSEGFVAKNGGILTDPDKFSSNFKTISRQMCSECHTRTEAGETCAQCHNYHAEPFMPVGMTPVHATASVQKK